MVTISQTNNFKINACNYGIQLNGLDQSNKINACIYMKYGIYFWVQNDAICMPTLIILPTYNCT